MAKLHTGERTVPLALVARLLFGGLGVYGWWFAALSMISLASMLQKTHGWDGVGVLAFVAMFPLVGLALAVPRLVRGIREVRVLRTGVETTGKIVGIAETNVVVRDVGPIMRATVEFLVGQQPYRTTFDFMEGNEPPRDVIERVVYDPRSPTNATTLDHLPGARVTEDGRIKSTSLSAPFLLIAPLIFIIALASPLFAL